VYAYVYAGVNVVKVISLSNRAYQILAKRKGSKSFSETIEEMADNKEKGDISELKKFFGIFKNVDVKAWKKEIREGRRKFKSRY